MLQQRVQVCKLGVLSGIAPSGMRSCGLLTKMTVALLTKGANPLDVTADGQNALQISRRLTRAIDYNRNNRSKETPKDMLCIEIFKHEAARFIFYDLLELLLKTYPQLAVDYAVDGSHIQNLGVKFLRTLIP